MRLKLINALLYPQWLAEVMLCVPLLLLPILIHMGVTGRILALVMPIEIWCAWLAVSGAAHLGCLLLGSRRARFICATVFLPSIYFVLLVAFGALTALPRRDVAFLSVSFVASIIVPFTLREKHGVS